MAASCCRGVTVAGPVSSYVRPRCPGAVSAARATEAMSAGWIAGSPVSGWATLTVRPARTAGAHHSALDANWVGRSTVHAIPLSFSSRSTARLGSSQGEPRKGSGMILR